ncbi:MAG: bacterial regulatory, tetR family protein [Conexibacter sp.]|nr:bacterial regulatory, tetR family protein [Conexibacter sp.]
MCAYDAAPSLRSDARANRDALLRAAAQLYAERGIDVSFDDIAQAAGVGRATIYRHFPSREDLLIGILDHHVGRLEECAAALPPSPDAFLTLFRAALRLQTDTLPLVELLPPRAPLPRGFVALRRRVHDVFRAPLQVAQEAGVVRPDLTVEDVRTLMAMLTAVVRPNTPRAEQRRAFRLALEALGAERPA